MKIIHLALNANAAACGQSLLWLPAGHSIAGAPDRDAVTCPGCRTIISRERPGRSACAGTFASGAPCPAAGECDRHTRGLVATSTRQVWSRFEADKSGERCEQFAAIELK